MDYINLVNFVVQSLLSSTIVDIMMNSDMVILTWYI